MQHLAFLPAPIGHVRSEVRRAMSDVLSPHQAGRIARVGISTRARVSVTALGKGAVENSRPRSSRATVSLRRPFLLRDVDVRFEEAGEATVQAILLHNSTEEELVRTDEITVDP